MTTFRSINPATGAIIWEGKAAQKPDINKAVEKASKAFEGWSLLPIEKRIEYLRAFKAALNQSKDALAESISKETGKPLWESKAEVNAMVNKVDISIDAYDHRCAEIIHDQPEIRAITRHKPHGVVAVFGPFNFPGHLPNGHIVPALLAGNTVIFKPSEFTPLVAELTMKCWEKAGLPPGVLNLVQGGRETGQLLSHHPGIKGLFFTGSWQTGKIFAEQFANQPEKILALEMGGNNPLVVYDISDSKCAAFLTIQSAFLTSGQRCTCARRLIIAEGKEGDAFLKELIHHMKGIHVGTYIDKPEPYMGPVISENTVKHLLEAQENLKAHGGEILVEMRQLKSGTGLISPGLMDVTKVVNRPDEELFGPFLQVIRVSNFEAAIKEANNTSFGLAAGLLSDRPEFYEKFYQKVKAGIINWNSALTGASSAAPFGGIGHSGNYRPSAYYAADYCSFPVASMEAHRLKLPAQMPPGITWN
jgi:succinylglutamic semialdehyde dehydrogenase